MKATEARKLTDDSKLLLGGSVIEKIKESIKSTAKKGSDTLIFDVGNHYMFVNEIISILKNDGFNVEHHKGSDERDGESWNYLTISW